MPNTRGRSKEQYTPNSPTSDSENLDPWLSWNLAGKSKAPTGQGTSSQPTSKDVPPPPAGKRKAGKAGGKKTGKNPPTKKKKTADLSWNSAAFVPPVVITIPDPTPPGPAAGGQAVTQAAGGQHSAPVVPPAAVFVPTPVPAPVPAPAQSAHFVPPQNPPAAIPPVANPPVFCGTPGCTIPNCTYLNQQGHVQQAATLAPVPPTPQPVPPPNQSVPGPVPPPVVNQPGGAATQPVTITSQQGGEQTVTLYEFDEKALERRLEDKFERIADNIFSKQDVFAGTVKTHLDHLSAQYKAISEKPTFKSEHHKKHFERAEVHKNFFKEAKYLLESDQKDSALATLITGIAAIDKYQENLLIADSSPFSWKLVERLYETPAQREIRLVEATLQNEEDKRKEREAKKNGGSKQNSSNPPQQQTSGGNGGGNGGGNAGQSQQQQKRGPCIWCGGAGHFYKLCRLYEKDLQDGKAKFDDNKRQWYKVDAGGNRVPTPGGK